MKIIAGNFKSNLNRKSTIGFLKSLDSTLDNISNKEIYIFPATSSLVENNFKHIILGAQNAHYAESGAFTGEITLHHLEEFNIKTILIAHSERRNLFGESDEICATKFDFFKERDFRIFYCIGESLEVRESGKMLEFLDSQISKIDLDYQNLVLAYEPLWAIGTGRVAKAEQISEIYRFLKSRTNAPIIYGGSVNEKNASEILGICDGVLVGSASLKVESFYEIIKG
ncbi:triose-phosphate isomerase [Helicobacter sp. 16-1353]|uniref:triose-phosphate isomerase n=1 Tax=Helicobacter sp. 16-1353 TaxID=2004996 RepID=UPI0015EF2109|nr:triose-phosphate isomerase [Helicobacter sp. 16-1353]